MKHAAILAIAAMLPLSAYAAAPKLELGVGVSKFDLRDDGLWYQEGMPHKLDMRSPAVSIGLTGDIT